MVSEESGRDLSRIRTEENGIAFVVLCGDVVTVSAEGWDIIRDTEGVCIVLDAEVVISKTPCVSIVYCKRVWNVKGYEMLTG